MKKYIAIQFVSLANPEKNIIVEFTTRLNPYQVISKLHVALLRWRSVSKPYLRKKSVTIQTLLGWAIDDLDPVLKDELRKVGIYDFSETDLLIGDAPTVDLNLSLIKPLPEQHAVHV
jgi:hypothetical protein